MDEDTLLRNLRSRPPADPNYRPRLAASKTPVAPTVIPQPIYLGAGRPRAMLSATRLFAIFAILTISTGTGALFLAASQGPTSVVEPSPSSTPWAPPSGLVTEEPSPGVLLVTGDGAGRRLDIRPPDERGLAFGPDGAIWLVDDRGLVRLGQDETYPAPGTTVFFPDLTVAPDGTPWVLAHDTVASFRDGVWTDAPEFPGEVPAKALEVLLDGTVWARSTTTLARLDGDVWTASPIEDEQGPIPDYETIFAGDLASTSRGGLWVTICNTQIGSPGLPKGRENLLRFDGQAWQSDPPEMGDGRCATVLAAGPDGEVWASFADRPGALARHDGTGWEISPSDAGIPGIGGTGWLAPTMVVGHDGRLWATGYRPEGDVLGVYDGTTWTDVYGPIEDTRLTEQPLEVAPDGSIWLWTDKGILVVNQ